MHFISTCLTKLSAIAHVIADGVLGFFAILIFLSFGLMAVLAPWIAVAGTLAWLARVAFCIISVRSGKAIRCRKLRMGIIALILVLFDAYFVSQFSEQYRMQMNDYQSEIEFTGKDSILTKQPIQHGEILIPAGSIVECLGYDYGSPDPSSHLIAQTRRLCGAQFSQPVTGGNVKFVEISIDPIGRGYAKLSEDQTIAGKACRKGQTTHFYVPYGIQDDDASRPSLWKFEGCYDDDKPVRLTPTPPPPKPGFWHAVWETLLPHPGGFYCC
jgi:hypothetical protein